MRILFAIAFLFASLAHADWTNPTPEQHLLRNRGQIATLSYRKTCEALFKRSPGHIAGYIVGVETDIFGGKQLQLRTDHGLKYISLKKVKGEIAITSPPNALAHLSLENQLVYETLRWAKATNGSVDLEPRPVSPELKANGFDFTIYDDRELLVGDFRSSVDGSTLIVTFYSNTKETGYWDFELAIDQFTAAPSQEHSTPTP